MEAGWLQPRTHGRVAALWAGPGRVVGTALGRVLLAFLAGGHGMVALVCWSRIAGGHRLRLRLRVRGMNHGSSCGVGHDRALGAAHLIQTAAGAGEADDDSGNKHHKDGHANGDGRSEP